MANDKYWAELTVRSVNAYNRKKLEVLNQLLDVVEQPPNRIPSDLQPV
ncbi:MAG: hypothetical protein IPP90_23210 [Gemmatimonadaceae bacterium]|nr:hypothetical protein [Gemmatimonadaceae bacterium]